MEGTGRVYAPTPMTEDESAKLKALVCRLFDICAALGAMFPGRPFTPDGHTMGSIGEVMAAAHYGLRLEPPSTTACDACARDGQRVEIKATGGKRGGATSIGFNHDPDTEHVLVVRVDSEGTMHPEFNGPGSVLSPHLSVRRKHGQRTITLTRLRLLQETVPEADRLDPVSHSREDSNGP